MLLARTQNLRLIDILELYTLSTHHCFAHLVIRYLHTKLLLKTKHHKDKQTKAKRHNNNNNNNSNIF